MFAVIFEVTPKPERWDDYLGYAKRLKPKLEAIDGFVDNERFRSRRDQGRLLSLSVWRDEKAVVRWRTQGEHHAVQQKGRFEVFEDYHLRVGQIVFDTDPSEPLAAEAGRLDETEIGLAKIVTLTEIVSAERGAGFQGLDPGAAGLVDHELFDSITDSRKLLVLGSWLTADAASAWSPARPAAAQPLRHRRVRIIRDYGMFERREAPQFYPEVGRAVPGVG